MHSFGPLIRQVGDFQNRQQVVLLRLGVSWSSISLIDEMHRIGENALYTKACSTLRETHKREQMHYSGAPFRWRDCPALAPDQCFQCTVIVKIWRYFAFFSR